MTSTYCCCITWERASLHEEERLHRLEENIGAAAIELTPDDLREIESAVAKIAVQGDGYPETLEKMTGL